MFFFLFFFGITSTFLSSDGFICELDWLIFLFVTVFFEIMEIASALVLSCVILAFLLFDICGVIPEFKISIIFK